MLLGSLRKRKMMSSIEAYKVLYNELLNDSDIPITASIAISKAMRENNSPSNKEVGEFLLTATEQSSGEEFSRFIKHLGHAGYLEAFLPEIDVLRECPQKKGRLRITDALDHTVMVIRYAPSPVLMLLALYHDAGKAHCSNGGYRAHDIKSAKIAYKRFIGFGYSIQLASTAYCVILNHMIPHDYQRRIKNSWDDERVIKFIKKCGGLNNALLTIELAIADKRASHDIKEYLTPYYELERRCKKLCPEAEKEKRERVFYCVNCLGPNSIKYKLKLSRATGMYICPNCKEGYTVDYADRLCQANKVTVIAEVVDVREEIGDE